MKKTLVTLLIGIMILSMTATCYASTELNLNHGIEDFNRLLLIEDGVTYIPLRVAFPNNANESNPGYNPDYAINIKPFIDQSVVELSMRRKDADGNLIENGRHVRICWSDEAKQSSAYGDMEFIQYSVDANGFKIGNPVSINNLSSEIKLMPVNAKGDRLFLAVSDIAKIVSFMTDGDNYSVNIIEE
ncbi:MAG: hypothetical protein IKV86_05600 [Clostridia bacterium]|nr:hypothetical protein [Clostridia bacterium]